MKIKKGFYLFLIIVPIIIFLLIIINHFYINNTEHISKIKLSIYENSDRKEYIFKDNENIKKLLEILEVLKTFQSEDNINEPYTDIIFSLIYNNNETIKKSYSIRPWRELFADIFNSTEFKKQNYWLFYGDVANTEKIVLKSKLKNNSIEITNKETINSITKELQNYYLSDESIEKNKYKLLSEDINIKFLPSEKEYTLNWNNITLSELLKQEGIYNQLVITVEDIENIFLTKNSKKIEIKNKDLIETILKTAQHGSRGTSVITVEAILKNSEKVYGSFLQDAVPQEIMELFDE